MKKISEKLKEKTEETVKMLLHASRDCLRNKGKNTLLLTFIAWDGWYAEAFGVMRGLSVCGYGEIGAVNVPGTSDGYNQDEQNLNWWFNKLSMEVLEEEGFYSDHRCEHCLKKYFKDDRSHFKLDDKNNLTK